MRSLLKREKLVILDIFGQQRRDVHIFLSVSCNLLIVRPVLESTNSAAGSTHMLCNTLKSQNLIGLAAGTGHFCQLSMIKCGFLTPFILTYAQLKTSHEVRHPSMISYQAWLTECFYRYKLPEKKMHHVGIVCVFYSIIPFRPWVTMLHVASWVVVY